MKIRPDDSDDIWNKGFTSENDVFQRRDLGDRLSNLMSSLDQGSVCIIDGQWGSGKTCFVKMWRAQLADRDIASVYIDAFSQDYISDPFEVIVGSIAEAAGNAGASSSKEFKSFSKSASHIWRSLAPAVAKIAVKAATAGALGDSEIKAISAAMDETSDAVADTVEAKVTNIISRLEHRKHEIEALRESIENLVNVIGNGTRSIVIIIDELDRCRPDFSVGIIEIIKHFFRSKNIHFVMSTNMESLRNSFSAVHNLNESADKYMEKFYDFVVILPDIYLGDSYHTVRKYVDQLFENVLENENKYKFASELRDYCVSLSVAYKFTIRQINSFCLLSSICCYAHGSEKEAEYMIVSHLIAMKITRPDLFGKCKIGEFTISDLHEFLPGESERYQRSRVFNRFFAFLTPDDSQVPEEYRDSWTMRLRHAPLNYVSRVANDVVDMFGERSTP